MSSIFTSGVLTVLAVAGSLAVASPMSAHAQAEVALVVVDVKAVALGYRASKLIGRPVTNSRGEEIGRIDDLVVGADKVLFAIIGVGGFLGVGQHLVVAPYNKLTVTAKAIVLPGATKEALRKLPEFHYLP
jgi:sporulation protein YlmC with PRC-barrel domain